jgi:hypothetical protein
MHDEAETIALTYAEVAKQLGVKLDSIRRHARRKRWRKVKGNDGTTRVLIPLDVLGRQDSPKDAPKDAPRDRPEDSQDSARTIATLTEHIARLSRELEAGRAVLEAAQGEAADLRAQLEAARLALAQAEALKATLTLVEAERDRWCREAGRSVLSRLFGRRAA